MEPIVPEYRAFSNHAQRPTDIDPDVVDIMRQILAARIRAVIDIAILEGDGDEPLWRRRDNETTIRRENDYEPPLDSVWHYRFRYDLDRDQARRFLNIIIP